MRFKVTSSRRILLSRHSPTVCHLLYEHTLLEYTATRLYDASTWPYRIPTPKGSISSEIPECSDFRASPTALDGEVPRGASRLGAGACDAVDVTGLPDTDADKGAGGSATVGSAGKSWSEAELSLSSRSNARGRGGNAAAIPPTAK